MLASIAFELGQPFIEIKEPLPRTEPFPARLNFDSRLPFDIPEPVSGLAPGRDNDVLAPLPVESNHFEHRLAELPRLAPPVSDEDEPPTEEAPEAEPVGEHGQPRHQAHHAPGTRPLHRSGARAGCLHLAAFYRRPRGHYAGPGWPAKVRLPPVAEYDAALERMRSASAWFAGAIAISATGVGIELGLFEALREKGAATPAALAAMLSLDPHAVGVWAMTLVHHGLLDPAGVGEVALAAGVELLVCDPRTPLYMAPLFEFHSRFLGRDFAELPRFFREGDPRPPARHGLPLVRNVAAQTAAMQEAFVSAMSSELPEAGEALAAGGLLLDAGCGAGGLGIRLCQQLPAARYLGVDLDELAVAEAKERIAAAGVAERARVEAMALEAVLNGSADAAIFFLSLHEFPPGTRLPSLVAVRQALRPGAWLLVLEELYPATPLEALAERSRAAIQFQYEELLWGSHLLTRAGLDSLLREAGFTEIVNRPMLGGNVDLVLARVS